MHQWHWPLSHQLPLLLSFCVQFSESIIFHDKFSTVTVRKPLAAARKKDFACATQHPNPITTIHRGGNGTGFLSLPHKLQHKIFGYWNVHDLFQLSTASHTTAKLATEYMAHQMELTIQCFFTDMQGFQQMLQSCNVVMSGSSTLHILLPSKFTSWVPADLNIYVPSLHYHYLSVLLENHGYHKIQEGKENISPYSFSLIHTVSTFANSNQQIDVIISKNTDRISPIFKFHSSMVMNFFSPDHFFCAYPALTLNLIAKINPGPLYFDCFQRHTLNTLLKYAEHRFHYTSCNSCHLSKRALSVVSPMAVQCGLI